MGLTKSSVGRMAAAADDITYADPSRHRIALAGNPNVGKSSVFNALTGMHQHTGNWPGKTVAIAQGEIEHNGNVYTLVDVPGTYSLSVRSPEEEVAVDFICFGDAEAVLLVCDATCLERNLNLVLQTLEFTQKVVVCVNLMDEAKKKGIQIDLPRLSQLLGVRVIGVTAREKATLSVIPDLLERTIRQKNNTNHLPVKYAPFLENEASVLREALPEDMKCDPRWASLRLLEDESWLEKLGLKQDTKLKTALEKANASLAAHGCTDIKDVQTLMVSAIQEKAHAIAGEVVSVQKNDRELRDRRIDRVLTGRWTGYPVMLLLLAFLFWLTISGANYPSALLSDILFRLQDVLERFMGNIHAPFWLTGILIHGAYRMTAWVVSVMLPPMAIFFPLFTLLEDIGYLPRVAFNLDRPFHRCGSCGKQALTMAMGFGCNAAGVIGCRIIDSPRERTLSIITNSFMPCNGRFPILISLLIMFFVLTEKGAISSLLSAALLTILVLLAIGITFLSVRILSATVLKGTPSSFALELPPYRCPQWGQVLIRSVLDRTVFVLGRALSAAAPAGMLLWVLANTNIGGETVLHYCAGFLDPIGHFLGMDGVTLLAFILGFPANETVIPIILMVYLSQTSLTGSASVSEIRSILLANGWTFSTALSVLIFTIFHWPCATTLLTIKKETKSMGYTLLSAVIPTAWGIFLCSLIHWSIVLLTI